MAIGNAADGVWDVETAVQECRSFAAQYDYLTINDSDGTVTVDHEMAGNITDYGGIGEASLTNSERDAKGRELTEMIADAVGLAYRVSSGFSYAIDCALRESIGCTAGSFETSCQAATSRPPRIWSPTEVSTWWAALTQAERDSIIADHPEWVGNLDGVDAASRDQANKNRLQTEINRAQAEVTRIRREELESGRSASQCTAPGRQCGGVGQDSSELAHAKDRLADLKAAQQAIEGHPDRHLLVLDTSGPERVRVAVATGDVDTADHVATFVPGMSSTPAGQLDDYLKFTEQLRNSAASNSEGISIATVTWIGYDAPAGVGEPGWTEVASTDRAEDGAERLQSFTEGINTSREGSGGAGEPDQTAIGHSYGSTTAGDAVATSKTGVVDQLIMFGSPGSGVQDIHEYNLDPDHVYVSAVDSNDMVQGMGSSWNSDFGINPDYLYGIHHLSNDAPEASGLLEELNPISRHSSYMEEGSGSLEDMARVAAGAAPVGESPSSVALRHLQNRARLEGVLGLGPCAPIELQYELGLLLLLSAR